ncbi:hypothetical protein Bca4012_019804 [Brassica carinata]
MDSPDQSAEHLLLSCQFAASVWTLAPILHSQTISTDPDFTAALQTSRKSINLPPAGVHLGSLFPWIVRTIWITRNQRLFENRQFDEKETLIKAIRDARGWQEAQQVVPHPTSVLQPPRLVNRTHYATILTNTDAAWRRRERLLDWLGFSQTTTEGHYHREAQ